MELTEQENTVSIAQRYLHGKGKEVGQPGLRGTGTGNRDGQVP